MKRKYTWYEKHTSICQGEADRMAFKLINQQEVFGLISVVQSICDFNLAWLYSVSPGVVIHEYSLKFLHDNIKEFKRKLTIREIIKFDGIIYHNRLEDFNQFKKELT